MDCIIWNGRRRKDGRPFKYLDGKTMEGIRYTYLKAYGKIPVGMCVTHSCKKIDCINLNHLYLRPKITPVIDRFLKNVTIPENKNLCWVWNGKKNKDGYGIFFFPKAGKTAHRSSYFLYKKDFDKNLCVCHICDNPGCVNPNHLWLGTPAENTKDRDLKGRRANTKPPIRYGENNHKTKLTKEQVLNIIELWNKGSTSNELSLIFGVSSVNILSICKKEIWKHETKDLFIRATVNRKKLKKSQISNIRELLAKGVLQKEIAKNFNVDRKTIWAIKNIKTWKHI